MVDPIQPGKSAAGPAQAGAGCAILMTPEQAENRGMLWIIGAFAFCPCHLPLTLGLLALLLSGTAAGVLLRSHPIAAGLTITAVWLTGTLRGIQYFRSAKRYALAITNPKI